LYDVDDIDVDDCFSIVCIRTFNRNYNNHLFYMKIDVDFSFLSPVVCLQYLCFSFIINAKVGFKPPGAFHVLHAERINTTRLIYIVYILHILSTMKIVVVFYRKLQLTLSLLLIGSYILNIINQIHTSSAFILLVPSSRNNHYHHHYQQQQQQSSIGSTTTSMSDDSNIDTSIVVGPLNDDVDENIVIADNDGNHNINVINNDIDNSKFIIGQNGNILIITWEYNIAMDIIQRAIQHEQKEQESNHHHQRRPYMVAIAGIPGSGKSSSSEIITLLINQNYDTIMKEQQQQQQESKKEKTNQSSSPNSVENDNDDPSNTDNNNICVCIPADGYHYSMEELNKLQQTTNDTTLIYRRGAPDTFNVPALIQDLQKIRNECIDNDNMIVSLPGFDHAIGDPMMNQHIYNRQQHNIVIIEGLYLLYNQYDWEYIQTYFDFTIYIQTHSIDLCMERLKQRNVCIPGYTVEEIYHRVDAVDRQNAILIDQISPFRAQYVITPSFVSSSSTTTTTTK
jgi:pantothenate kinase